jgi:3-methyladenine DNA glycosylase AlkD
VNPAAEAVGTPERAAAEKAYLKSSLEFVGTGVPAMRRIAKAWLRERPALTHDELIEMVEALWDHPVHECCLVAVEFLVLRPALITAADVPLIERLLRESRTWALVDPLAGWVMAELVARDPDATLPVLDRWVGDPDFWLRRSAVLALRSALRRGGETDRFYRYCAALLPEREFFIRKVIGWVLREEAGRDPDAVSEWLRDHMAQMNLVTLREPMRKLADAASLRELYDARRKREG